MGIQQAVVGGGAQTAISLSASPTSVSVSDAPGNITTGPCTVTATGGSGAPKTYAWTFAANPGALTINSPSVATTTFSKMGAVSGNSYFATARCTVQDGSYSSFIDVPVEIECF